MSDQRDFEALLKVNQSVLDLLRRSMRVNAWIDSALICYVMVGVLLLVDRFGHLPRPVEVLVDASGGALAATLAIWWLRSFAESPTEPAEHALPGSMESFAKIDGYLATCTERMNETIKKWREHAHGSALRKSAVVLPWIPIYLGRADGKPLGLDPFAISLVLLVLTILLFIWIWVDKVAERRHVDVSRIIGEG